MRFLLIFVFVCCACASEIKDMESKCAIGEFNSCLALGEMQEERLDNKSAAIFYEKACGGNEFRACGKLANLYANGLGVAQDKQKANLLYNKGCDGGDAVSCGNLSLIYYAENNYEQSARLLFKACDSGDFTACSNLGVLYARANGVKQNYHKAKEYFTKACDNNVGAGCANLGVAYYHAMGTTQQCDVALEYFSKACDFGSQAGCRMHECYADYKCGDMFGKCYDEQSEYVGQEVYYLRMQGDIESQY